MTIKAVLGTSKASVVAQFDYMAADGSSVRAITPEQAHKSYDHDALRALVAFSELQ